MCITIHLTLCIVSSLSGSRFRAGGGVREGVLPREGARDEGQTGAARLLPQTRAHRQEDARKVREGERTHVSDKISK